MERWKINLYTVWSSQILSLMSFSFGIPFLSFYIQELGITAPDKIKIYTGILSTAPALTMAVMAPIWGIIADKWGKKLMLLRAMFFGSIVIAGMGMVTNIDQLIILRLAQGIFTGTITAAMTLVATGTPSNRLSFAIGLMLSSTFIGTSAGPVIGGFLAEFTGYRTSFYIGGALMAIDFILVLLFVKEEKIIEQPDAYTMKSVANIMESTTDSMKPAADTKKPAADTKKPVASFFSMFSGMMAIMLLLLFILRLSRAVFSPYLPLFVQEELAGKGGVITFTGIVNGVTGLMSALSGLTLSRLGDKYNKLTLLRILFTAGIILSLPLAIFSNLWVFTILYGIFFYVIGGIEPIIISITSENTPPERRGALFGVQGLVGNLAWTVSPMIGSFISIRFSIQAILIVIPVTLLPALLVVFISKYSKKNAEI
jgi:MFS transporter, DHA1 family, multidrug resistance protein